MNESGVVFAMVERRPVRQFLKEKGRKAKDVVREAIAPVDPDQAPKLMGTAAAVEIGLKYVQDSKLAIKKLIMHRIK